MTIAVVFLWDAMMMRRNMMKRVVVAVAVEGCGLIRRRSVYEREKGALGVRGCCSLLSLSGWHGLLHNQMINVI